MAKRIREELTDDLDGGAGEDVVTRKFGLDGKSYEIELGDDNYDMLAGALQPFVAAARQVAGARTVAPAKPRSQGDREKSRKIREWAGQHGIQLSDRGRIPGRIVAEYEAATA